MNISDEALKAAWNVIEQTAKKDEGYEHLNTIDPAIIYDALEAALPHIRKQIAADIRAHMDTIPGATFTAGHRKAGLETAARIAEKGNQK